MGRQWQRFEERNTICMFYVPRCAESGVKLGNTEYMQCSIPGARLGCGGPGSDCGGYSLSGMWQGQLNKHKVR